MESNAPLCQKLSFEPSKITASKQEISTHRELNDLDLEAIAGGCSDMADDRARAAGIPVITTSQPLEKPRLTIPMNVFEFLGS
ncbi:hypothetical protein QUB10_18805 [Microcoleus sp. B5-D4]|uniref:hypothetical protein n=1 Tax=unclassified Microcoleus TaxID=2642155 RepID=UPI002FD062DC